MNMVNDIRSGGLPRKMVGAVVGLMRGLKEGNVLTIPIKGLTLVRLWWISQFTFAGAMAMTWYVHLPGVFLFERECKKADGRFTTTVHGAYVIIGITGFSWGLAQCKSALAYP
jgi:solute carrier family 45 protein 1/2/4